MWLFHLIWFDLGVMHTSWKFYQKRNQFAHSFIYSSRTSRICLRINLFAAFFLCSSPTFSFSDQECKKIRKRKLSYIRLVMEKGSKSTWTIFMVTFHTSTKIQCVFQLISLGFGFIGLLTCLYSMIQICRIRAIHIWH